MQRHGAALAGSVVPGAAPCGRHRRFMKIMVPVVGFLLDHAATSAKVAATSYLPLSNKNRYVFAFPSR